MIPFLFVVSFKYITLEFQSFPVLGEESFCVRTLPNCKRNGARSYYYIVYKEHNVYSSYLGVDATCSSWWLNSKGISELSLFNKF